MPEDNATSVFTIDGKDYEIPTIASFDLDEAQILWDNCGVALEDFAPDQEDGSMSDEMLERLAIVMKNPAFRRTLMHVAYRRGNRTSPKKHIEDAIGRVSNADSLSDWASQFMQENDANPPAPSPSTIEPKPSFARSSDVSNGNSGSTSSIESDEKNPLGEPDDLPANIGAMS